MTAIANLPVLWRERADMLRRHGATEAAASTEALADELEAALRSEADDVLNLDAAASESGFSRDHLARLVRDGKIANAGKPHSPRIRRADLPRKSGRTLIAGGRYGNVADVRRRMAATVVDSQTGD